MIEKLNNDGYLLFPYYDSFDQPLKIYTQFPRGAAMKFFMHSLCLSLFAFIIIIANSFTWAAAAIPYPHALARAAIRVNNLYDMINGSLIIGNGDINALVFSDSAHIVMTLSKNDVWDARLMTENDPPLPTIRLIKQLGSLEDGFPLKDNNRGYVLPPGMKWDTPDSYHAHAYPCPRQCARLVFKPIPEDIPVDGRIDLKQAVVQIGKNQRHAPVEIRALADRNVFLLCNTTPLKLQPVKSKDVPEAVKGQTNGIFWLHQHIPGDADWKGMDFAVAAGSRDNWQAISIVTSHESADVVRDAIAAVRNVLATQPSKLISRHETIWQSFWSHSGIVLEDTLLQHIWYRSLYFLRCVSKPGVQSVGLFAGLFNDTPAWHGDYHTNYNFQQTYWGAYASNHPELAEPYDRLIYEYLPRAKWLARRVFDTHGAYYPHVLFAYEPPFPDSCRSHNGRQYFHSTWGMTIGVSGFTVQPLWWRYLYDPNPERLRKLVFPVLKQVALFYADFIDRCDGDSKVRLGPSVSPEHWGWTKGLERNYNCSFDIAMIRYTLQAAIKAADILQQDSNFAARLKHTLQQLPDYPLSNDPVPVVVDVEGAPPIKYNIPVPATPVFPADVIHWWSADSEKQLFSHTIDLLEWNGNNAMVMLAVARARLSIHKSQEWLNREVISRLRPNGTLALNKLVPHHHFNDFGHYTEQFGIAIAVSELLVQSVNGIIRIFPALTPGQKAQFTDLRVQGGFLITASGSGGSPEALQIRSPYGGHLRFQTPWPRLIARHNGETDYKQLMPDTKGIVEIQTSPGDVWHFRNGN